MPCGRAARTFLLAASWALPCGCVRGAGRSANGTLQAGAAKPREPRAADSVILRASNVSGHKLPPQTGIGTHALVAHTSNQTRSKAHFSPLDYPRAVGKVFAFYYSSASEELATSVEAREYKELQQAPSSSDLVYDPGSGAMVKRGGCPLRLTSQTNYPSDQRKANLRLAELAVCDAFHGSPCPGGAAGCELEILAPLPYADEQEPYVGAAMALVAHSLLCARRASSLQREACAIRRSAAAISAGLRFASGGVELLPLPSPWVDLKLDACYTLGFREAVFAAANRKHYFSGEHYAKKHDVLAWERAPPDVVFCKDLPCLIAKFER